MRKEPGTGTMTHSRQCYGRQKSEDDQAMRLLQQFADIRTWEHIGAERRIRLCGCSQAEPVGASVPLPHELHLPIGKHRLDSDVGIRQQSMLGVAFQQQY